MERKVRNPKYEVRNKEKKIKKAMIKAEGAIRSDGFEPLTLKHWILFRTSGFELRILH